MSVEQSFNGFHHDGDFMVHSIWHVRSALEGGSSLHEPVRFVGRTYLRLDNLIPWSPVKSDSMIYTEITENTQFLLKESTCKKTP